MNGGKPPSVSRSLVALAFLEVSRPRPDQGSFAAAILWRRASASDAKAGVIEIEALYVRSPRSLLWAKLVG